MSKNSKNVKKKLQCLVTHFVVEVSMRYVLTSLLVSRTFDHGNPIPVNDSLYVRAQVILHGICIFETKSINKIVRGSVPSTSIFLSVSDKKLILRVFRF